MEKIAVLLIEPMEPPNVVSIQITRKTVSDIVGADAIEHGGIEAIRLEEGVYALFNKDRFLADLIPNRRIGEDIISGNILIVAVDGNEKPISLTPKQIKTYSSRFWNPETFDEMEVMETNLNLFFSRLLQDEEC